MLPNNAGQQDANNGQSVEQQLGQQHRYRHKQIATANNGNHTITARNNNNNNINKQATLPLQQQG